MKIISFSLCTSLALLGSIGCGNSNNPGSGIVGSAGVGPNAGRWGDQWRAGV